MKFPKIVYDNTIFNLQIAGGISAYWYKLCKKLSNYDVVYFGEKNDNIFSKDLDINILKESILPTSLLRYLPFTKKIKEKSIFHSSYYRVCLQKNVLNITTVYDFTYEYFMSGLQQKVHAWQKSFALHHSTGIICISESTKSDLLKFLPELDSTKIKVIYVGVSEDFYPIDNHLEFDGFTELHERKFVLFVGDRSPYKNFNKVVEVVKKIPSLNLVIVGGKTLTSSERLSLSSLNDRFFAYKGVSAKTLNWLYNRAFCLLYPSSYEGFGIPVVEAMKAGCPVVSTNLSSIPEVAGDAALLADSPDSDSLLKKVNLLFNPIIREDLRIKGFKQASKFSWDRCFEETITFYHEVWSRERNGE